MDKKRAFIVNVLYYGLMLLYFVVFLLNKTTEMKTIISPTLLKVLFPLSWFVIQRNKKTTIPEILIFIVFHFLLGERTAVLCIAFMLLLQFVMQKTSQRTADIIFVGVIVVAVALPFVYTWLSEQTLGEALNTFVYTYTGENLFSGRHRIWKIIFNGLKDNWFFGLGFDNTLLADHGVYMSTHNLYMYLIECSICTF